MGQLPHLHQGGGTGQREAPASAGLTGVWRAATRAPMMKAWQPGLTGPGRHAAQTGQNAVKVQISSERCPVAHTERFGGGWLPTRYEDVSAIAYDTDHFSSRAIIMSNFRPPRELAPVGGSPPISSDPPFHHDARKLLLPAFTKKAVAK